MDDQSNSEGTPLACRISLVGQGFIPCRQIFHRRGVKPRPTLKPNFPCRAGFYTLPTNFHRRGVKPRPTLSRISLVGQGFTPCRQIFHRRGVKPRPTLNRFSSRSGSSPTLRDLFRLGGSLALRILRISFFFGGHASGVPSFLVALPLVGNGN